MKINSIEIEGFWSYRDQQHIDINDLSLVIGVGENGAGKSMLLVSTILVAFYGKFPTNTIEESITDGAAQGHISVEFTIGDTLYRVGRMYPRTGTASGVVAIADPSQKTGWRTVTEKGIREVNAYMVELLGMDYTTATMTWIAEQGQYGRFSAAAPAERFKLLANVFGLDEYGVKAKLATAAASVIDKELDQIDGRINELTELLEPEVDGEAATSEVATDAELAKKVDIGHSGIDRVGEDLASLSATDPRKLTVETRQALGLLRNERVNNLDTATATQQRATTSVASARSRANIGRERAVARHDDAVAQADTRLAQVRDDAERSRVAAVAVLAEIAATKHDLPILSDTVAGHREAADDHRAQMQTYGSAAGEARGRHSACLSDWAASKVEVETFEARIAKLAQFADGEHVDCFTCGQHLGADDATALIETQRRGVEEVRARQVTIKSDGEAASAAAEAAEAQKANHASASAESDDLARTAASILSRAEALIATFDERQQQADTADITMNRAGVERDSTVAVAAVERDGTLAALSEDEDSAVSAGESEIAESTPVIAANAEPSAEEMRLVAALNAAEATMADEVQSIDSRRQDLESERQVIRAEVADVQREIQRRVTAQEAEDAQRKRMEAAKVKRSSLAERKTVADTLVRAYSPGGIPAMILAGVIEELNEAVNVSLDRLSRGELSIQLRTSRENQSGMAVNKISVFVETLSGTRAYETLSGGQKFRVDLALRTGLAKAIARGTGTPIQTFILDEGWGSLDEKGLLSTFDTLFRLSEEMNVVTVSHIDAVKETFPARVEIASVGGTSVAEVIR
jgi:exonuclease SbcC